MAARALSALGVSPSGTKGVHEFPLADIGEGIAEVELLEWHVGVGDEIEQFQKVCTVQSDKASVEITSRYDGTVAAVHHVVGAMVDVGAILVDIAPPGDAVPAAAARAAAAPAATAPAAAAAPAAAEKALATPAVRRIAKEAGLDVAAIVGTGPRGRILKGDALAAAAAGARGRPAVIAPAAAEMASPTEAIRGVRRLMYTSMTASPAALTQRPPYRDSRPRNHSRGPLAPRAPTPVAGGPRPRRSRPL